MVHFSFFFSPNERKNGLLQFGRNFFFSQNFHLKCLRKVELAESFMKCLEKFGAC